MLPVPLGTPPSYIPLGPFVWWQQRIQNQIIRAMMALSTIMSPTTPPTIAPVWDFEEECAGDCVPVFPPGTREAEGVEEVTTVVWCCSLRHHYFCTKEIYGSKVILFSSPLSELLQLSKGTKLTKEFLFG